jgi:sugar O-acyltransferase (sialic acid O-acetyltransferase NeuD family)
MKLLIYGSGGLGKEVSDLACRINNIKQQWSEIAFIDDFREESELNGIRVYKFDEALNLKDVECIIAVGEPNSREKLYNLIRDNNLKIGTLIDPSAIISKNAVIEEGSIINPFVLVAYGSHIGSNTLIQSHVNIGHDIVIGKHSVISAGVYPGGGDVIGDRVYIGMGVIIKEKLTIGNDSIIGMGSCVFTDIPSNVIVLGNPARVIRKNEEGKIFK